MKRCPKCNSELSDNAVFCSYCGARADELRCAHCGATLAPGHAFCGQCGQPVAQPEPEPEAQPVAGKPDLGVWGVLRRGFFIMAVLWNVQLIVHAIIYDSSSYMDYSYYYDRYDFNHYQYGVREAELTVAIVLSVLFSLLTVWTHIMCKIRKSKGLPIRQDMRFSLGLRIPALILSIAGLATSLGFFIAAWDAYWNDVLFYVGMGISAVFTALLVLYIRMRQLSKANEAGR